MARVDFYLLKSEGEQARALFACRLAEKAYRLKNTVHIHTDDPASAARLDDLLWTFRDGSFVPHDLSGGDPDRASPVTIGSDLNVEPRDLLINLATTVPEIAGAFPRVAELVTSDDDAKQLSRKRFVVYRDQGHELETHNI